MPTTLTPIAADPSTEVAWKHDFHKANTDGVGASQSGFALDANDLIVFEQHKSHDFRQLNLSSTSPQITLAYNARTVIDSYTVPSDGIYSIEFGTYPQSSARPLIQGGAVGGFHQSYIYSSGSTQPLSIKELPRAGVMYGLHSHTGRFLAGQVITFEAYQNLSSAGLDYFAPVSKSIVKVSEYQA